MTETLGQPGDPAVVLVMGATASMLGWPDDFCTALVERGLFVIRFDHRDTGGSTTLPPGEATYAVEDMAGDVLAILDAYGLARAHVVGMSLGGYIAQMLTLKHPDRAASLVLIASEPLGWDGAPLPHISGAFLDHFAGLGTLDWTDDAAVTEFLLASERLSAGTAVPFDEQGQRSRIARVLARTDSPASMFNHAGLTLREDWTGRFRDIAGPVSVIHGDEDPILPVANGRAIAEGIAGARLLLLPGIGHELPSPVLPLIADEIAAQVRAAGA
ncbi:alpha/beta fold hydrolase [Paracoccus zhejiangensis]|nr:alpha/beta hydrolase [Paracoccus zhejiangensis]